MNVDWVIPCRYAEVHDNLGTLIGAGVDTYWVPTLPTPISVVMAIRMSGLPEELQQDVMHQARSIIRGPGGAVISEIAGEFSVGGGQNVDRPDFLQGILMHAVITFEATEAGSYSFEHMVDNSSVTIPLHVVHGPPPGAPAA